MHYYQTRQERIIRHLSSAKGDRCKTRHSVAWSTYQSLALCYRQSDPRPVRLWLSPINHGTQSHEAPINHWRWVTVLMPMKASPQYCGFLSCSGNRASSSSTVVGSTTSAWDWNFGWSTSIVRVSAYGEAAGFGSLSPSLTLSRIVQWFKR